VKRTLLWAGIALALAGCKKADPAPVYMKVAVERRDIVVTASAAGAIQPILAVSVKSQASGAITEMHVQTGDDDVPPLHRHFQIYGGRVGFLAAGGREGDARPQHDPLHFGAVLSSRSIFPSSR